MSPENIVQQLAAFSQSHHLKEEAMNGCRTSMQNCIADDPEGLGGFEIDELKLIYLGQRLIVDSFYKQMPFLKIEIGIFKKEENEIYVEGHERIGYYEYDVELNGESFDDWLIIREEKNNQMNVTSELPDFNALLPQKYLRRNSVYYEYVSYFSHIVQFYQAKNYEACQQFMIRAFKFETGVDNAEEFLPYHKATRQYVIRVAEYLEECQLIRPELYEQFYSLGIIKNKE